MDNMRGVHVLAIFRQWYCRLLIPRLEDVARRVLPDEQQGFRPEGRIYASFLSLYSLLENARLRKERLYICFIDTQKAFPSVRRDLLLQQLAAAGADDDLLRALHVLYSDTRACIRSADGYGSIFDIFLGTREGGVESPILYSLFVFDLVAKLSTVELDSSPLLLGDSEIRLLQFADDLALIARSAEDLELLLFGLKSTAMSLTRLLPSRRLKL